MEWFKSLVRFVWSCACGIVKAMIVREALRLLDRWKDPDMQ